jgi:hypothetical protein
MHPELFAHYQACQGVEGMCSEHREHNPRRGGWNNREGSSLSPMGLGPQAFRSNVRDTCFPNCCQELNNVAKYDGKTNPSIWLEDYHFTGKACRTSSSSNTTRAWLDHLLRNTIDNWEDLKEIFTGSYQATYLRPGNPWDLKGCQ